jgi:acyl-CoA synthetase (AMP-forming)/AMP-acid ligase II
MPCSAISSPFRGLSVLGLMNDSPLTITSILQHAMKWHPDEPIVSRLIGSEGDRNASGHHRYTYLEMAERSCQLASALVRVLDVKQGERVATLAFSSYRHMEAYYGIPGVGAICHTINPRLHEEQLNYILNDAADGLIFVVGWYLVSLIHPVFPV